MQPQSSGPNALSRLPSGLSARRISTFGRRDRVDDLAVARDRKSIHAGVARLRTSLQDRLDDVLRKIRVGPTIQVDLSIEVLEQVRSPFHRSNHGNVDPACLVRRYLIDRCPEAIVFLGIQ